MQENRRETARVGYKAKFRNEFFYPKYWLIWLVVAGMWLLAFLPRVGRDKFALLLAKLVTKFAHKQRQRAMVNLDLCFPDLSYNEKYNLIEQMFGVGCCATLALGEIYFRSRDFLLKNVEIKGLDQLYQAKKNKQNVILLHPHSWTIDIAGIINIFGFKMCAFYNPHRNPLVDFLWVKVREKFGGQTFARQNGLKPFISEVKAGYFGYYLPDEDYGEELSEFVDFFATQKATLPILGKLSRLTKAKVIPIYSTYNVAKHRYEIEIKPPLELATDDEKLARQMNEVVEYFVKQDITQYLWFLKILKTRPNKKNIYNE